MMWGVSVADAVLYGRNPIAPGHRFGRQIGDDAVAADGAEALPLPLPVRRPRHDADPARVQLAHELLIDVVVAGEAPAGADPLRVIGQVEEVPEHGDAEGEGNLALVEPVDGGVIEGGH